MIEEKPMSNEEKKFLIGALAGTILISLLLLLGAGYFILKGALQFKYLSDEKTFMIVLYPLIFLLVVALQVPGIIAIFKDLSSKKVSQTMGTLTDVGRGLSAFDKHIHIDTFGKT